MLRFYRWLFRWSEKKCKRHINCDLKCPRCLLWFSSVAGDLKYNDTGYEITCGQCGEKTNWHTFLAPVPLRITDPLAPFEIEKSKQND